MKHAKKIVIASLLMAFMLSLSPTLQAGDATKININAASVEQLTQLTGVGAAYAEKIIKYRKDNGPFTAAEDIVKVPGIGRKTYEKNKDQISVD